MSVCRNCGAAESEARVENQYVLKSGVIDDDYCGACGVNWGHVAAKRPEKKSALQPLPHGHSMMPKV